MSGPRSSSLSHVTNCSSRLFLVIIFRISSLFEYLSFLTFAVPCVSKEYVENTTPESRCSLKSPRGIAAVFLGITSTFGFAFKSFKSRSASYLKSALVLTHSTRLPPRRTCSYTNPAICRPFPTPAPSPKKNPALSFRSPGSLCSCRMHAYVTHSICSALSPPLSHRSRIPCSYVGFGGATLASVPVSTTGSGCGPPAIVPCVGAYRSYSASLASPSPSAPLASSASTRRRASSSSSRGRAASTTRARSLRGARGFRSRRASICRAARRWT
mmetsp:Transcript_6686/g.26821  ORF Transcript_6686/g.26821 Transcript_6686/m.26821 type:complete len:271 (+) Transcript_6686:5321-6133(+)